MTMMTSRRYPLPMIVRPLRATVDAQVARGSNRAEGEEMSVVYCDISHWLLFSSLVLTIVALVPTFRDRAKASHHLPWFCFAASRRRFSGLLLLPLDPLKQLGEFDAILHAQAVQSG